VPGLQTEVQGAGQTAGAPCPLQRLPEGLRKVPIPESQSAARKVKQPQQAEAKPPKPATQPQGQPEQQRTPAKAVEPVRLERIDEMGAYFEFPSDQLPDVHLRSSFPRRCVSCGCRDRLQVHLLIWTDRLPPRDQIRRQETAGQLVGSLDQFEGQSAEEFLGRLPRIRSLPSPYDLPFPYYICENCSAVGEIHTHVLLHGDKEYCQIKISNLEIAAEFLANNGGADTEDYQLLLEAWQKQKQDPWRALPLAVRNRLRQWYQPSPDEKFVDYFPDADFSKAELGLAGIVLTSKRAVYKKFAALREFELNKPASIRCTFENGRCQIEISQSGKRPAVINLQKAAAERFVERCRCLWAGIQISERKISPTIPGD